MDAADDPRPEPLDRALETAALAVRRAARLLRSRRYSPPPLLEKPDGSRTTQADLESERLLREIIRQRHPDHAIVGEELPLLAGSGGWIWLLDPLDGTRAFAAGQDNCSVSATLTRDGVPLVAAVASPFTGEIFTARAGRPPTVNGRPLRVAPERPLADRETLVYYDAAEPGLGSLFGAAVRRQIGRISVLYGSFALNCCRVARGAYDAFLSVKRTASPLMPWDLAPPALLLKGAGGVMLDLEGRSVGGLVPCREVAAGSPAAVEALIRMFGPQIRDPRPALAWARASEPAFARLWSTAISAAARAEGRPCLIGIGGAGGGIGKTTLARELAALLGPGDCALVSLDDYLISRSQRDALGIGAHDPAANDLTTARADLARLRAGTGARKPVYDHALGAALGSEEVPPRRFVIAEGVHALNPGIRPLLDLTVFLDASAAVRFRRISRDMREKGVSEAYARALHERFEEDCRRFLLPLREAADIILAVDEAYGVKWISPG